MRRRLVTARAIVACAATISLILLAGCAAESIPTPTLTEPAPAETAEPALYDGPALFIGDELDWFVPDTAALLNLLPGSADATGPSDQLTVVSDGGGEPAVPSICDVLAYEVQMDAIAARTVEWSNEKSSDAAGGKFTVMQYPGEGNVQAMVASLRSAGESCADFGYSGPSSFSQVVDLDGDIDVLTGFVSMGDGDGQWNALYGYVAAGNVLVQLVQPADEGAEFDGEAIAMLLRDVAEDADDKLRAKLTENPPAPDDGARDDPAAAWSDWQITANQIGPLRTGDPVEDALAAIPGVQTHSERDGEWILTDAEGDSLTLRSEDGVTITSLMAGAENLWGTEELVDGAALPSAEGARIGQPASAAFDAFPGGTHVRVVSSGQEQYWSANRDGGVIKFALDPDAPADSNAAIVGILVAGPDSRSIPTF